MQMARRCCARRREKAQVSTRDKDAFPGKDPARTGIKGSKTRVFRGRVFDTHKWKLVSYNLRGILVLLFYLQVQFVTIKLMIIQFTEDFDTIRNYARKNKSKIQFEYRQKGYTEEDHI